MAHVLVGEKKSKSGRAAADAHAGDAAHVWIPLTQAPYHIAIPARPWAFWANAYRG
jgi:hypothetical protein